MSQYQHAAETGGKARETNMDTFKGIVLDPKFSVFRVCCWRTLFSQSALHTGDGGAAHSSETSEKTPH